MTTAPSPRVLSHGPLRALALGLTAIAVVLSGALLSPVAAATYTPPAGVKTNNPLGSTAARRTIVEQVVRSIDATPRKSQIMVASWNIRSREVVDALIRAHQRKVGVRVVMDRLNANGSNPNQVVNRLQAALKGSGNASRGPALRSGLTKCVSSCRGYSGIAHSKFFLFKRAGNARFVVMNGSWNATDLATTNQWNDLYTVRGKRAVYSEFKTVFDQMYADTPVTPPYRTADFGSRQTSFYPFRGPQAVGDPVLDELNRTVCTGARNTGGRTKIRIAQTSWFGERGIAIAQRIRQMKNRGCDVRIVYAVMGNEVLRILRRGGPRPVPLTQIVQDFDRDGVYDRYLHMKVMTIKGNYDGNPRATVTVNGSANWSPAALASDEAVVRITGSSILARYNSWIDYLFTHKPRYARAAVAGRSVIGPVDPYAKVQPD